MSMATSNFDELKSVASPLDLSLKITSTVKPINDDVADYEDIKNSLDHKSVSSEELLSLKLLHDRLSKTMELLLPTDKQKQCEETKFSQTATSTTDKNSNEFDYKSTMRALLSLMESDNSTSNDEEEKTPNFFPSKVPAPNIDSWSYWHDYILSLYLMNSSISSSLPPMPQIPPPPIPPTMPPPFNFLTPSPSSMLFQGMLNNLVSRSSTKPQEESVSKNFLLHEGLNQDFGYKSKKLNSYQLLKDSSLLYNSFATSRNIGLTKTKLLDSPESYGVSLRGNQKYSIYYQQRPNNIFNNNFLSPACSSTVSSKLSNKHSPSNNQHNSYFSENTNLRKSHISLEPVQKRSLSINSNNKVQKLICKNEISTDNCKSISEKTNKYKSLEQESINGSYANGSSTGFDGVSGNIPLCSRQRETVFNCSCGQDFENLYSFTIHMKSTHHSPNSSKIERSIPKLVRGQDMWINSETEQTKEILRCMRCHQSFRTLPELTMHMVETNHYSEIVYSDTGKCVFLNSENMKIKAGFNAMSSPISSPGDIIRKLKRTLSSSTGSEVGAEEENCKRLKLSSPIESPRQSSIDISSKDTEAEPEMISTEQIDTVKGEETLQITEADSGTVDVQPDSESQNISREFKSFDFKDLAVNVTNSSDSVIRQIENFVEKSLPKPFHTDFSGPTSAFSVTNSNHKTSKASVKSVSTKLNNVDRIWKGDSKQLVNEKLDSFPKHKEQVSDVGGAFNLNNYSISSLDSAENPLSSLQSLVETIQKNTNLNKDQGPNNYKVNQPQNKDSSTYSYPSKSPLVCDSLSQLQALVAGTSMNNTACHTAVTSSKTQDQKPIGYPFMERSKLFQSSDIGESSATFLSWCHKLGELLGLPQALSQAMLTPDAIKDLTNSVFLMNRNNSSFTDRTDDDSSNMNQNHNVSKTEFKTEKTNRDSDPLEQLKNLLNSTSDSGPTNNSHKIPNGSNPRPSSSPTISKKAKCHFCNKPFANKGQVRLHISKGKCSSLLRSSHSNFSQLEDASSNRNSSPNHFDSNMASIYKLRETIVNDGHGKRDLDSNSNNCSSKDSLTINNKSANLIREYFKFAKQMIGSNDESQSNSPKKIENKVE